MKLKEIYELAVEIGMDNDPRGKENVLNNLKAAAVKYKELKEEEKKEFDKETLNNPYSDTRIIYAGHNKEIKTIMVGIDIDVSEVLLADKLSEKGEKVDLILGHHPLGFAYANFYEVMDMQSDIWHKFGVPINVAESLMGPRKAEVERRVLPVNHMKTADAARLLDIPLMCAHTVADNCVVSFLQSEIDAGKFDKLSDIMKFLKKIPEYAYSQSKNAGPKILVGSESSRTGKIMVDMTGGTEPPKEIHEKASQAGIGTILAMHYSDAHKDEIKKHHINAIIAGHIASDNVGINILLDQILKKDRKIKIVECSGYHRVSRLK